MTYPRGTVTLVFTGIEGSTRLVEILGETYGEALTDHRALLRDAFTSHGGVEVDTQGDALFYAFSRARDAVAASVEAQQALDSHTWPANTEVRVRMGLHTGEPQTSSEGYVGADVHLAARICSAAHGEQVLISNSTKDLIDDTHLEGATLRDLGEHVLRDISSRVHLYQLVIHGLRSDFPPPRTRDARPTNLSRIPRALIGRAEKVAELTRALREGESRMVTLTGPGGIGKTRLAIEVGHHLHANVGFAALELGELELEQADASFSRALELSRDLNQELGFVALEALAAIAARGGRSDEAASLLVGAEALRQVGGFARERYEQALYEGTKALIEGEHSVHEGRAL